MFDEPAFFALQNQNKALIEELRSLKELYSGKSFGSNHDVSINIFIISAICDF